jgi:ABC-type nitrate/sulfonate/bicarbonate transport system substrate-binding protein
MHHLTARHGALALLLFLVACAPATPPASPPAPPAAAPATVAAPAAASAPAPTAAPAPVTLNYGISGLLATYWVSFVGLNRGFFADEGINLEEVLTETSTRGGQLLIAGAVDISNNSPDSIVLAVERGADLAVVGVEVERPVYTVLGQPSIRSMDMLRGQKMAVSDLKSGPTSILRRTLQLHGLSDADVDLIPSGGTSARFAALKSGAVAATIMNQPDDFRALDEGFTRLALSTEAIQDYTFNSPTVRRDWARANADVLVRFLRAFGRAADWLYAPANRDEAVAILIERTKQDEKYVRQTYDLAVTQAHMYADRGRPRIEGMQNVLELLASVDELARPLPPPDKYLDFSYWERAWSR